MQGPRLLPHIGPAVCARKHGFTETSVEANKQATKRLGEKMILEYLSTHADGTLPEIADHYGKEKNEISGRFTELTFVTGHIVRTGEKRGGCYVYQLAK